MRALVKLGRGEGQVKLIEREPVKPGPGEVMIRVLHASVCAADIQIQNDRLPYTPPVTLGHEFVGLIEEIGTQLDYFWPGDRVVAENNPHACCQCDTCRNGYPNLCKEKKALGIHTHGAFADYITVPGHLLKLVPETVDSESAALVEPLAASIHAVNDRAGMASGDTVVVLGAGANGLLSAQAARAGGAGKVIVAGNSLDARHRLPVAASLGFEICNVENDGIKDMVMDVTRGAGADLVVETYGTDELGPSAPEWLRRGGCIMEISLTGNPNIRLPREGLVDREIDLRFSYSSRHENWTRGLRWMESGAVQVKPLITHRATLEEWEPAFHHMKRPESIRAVFNVGNVSTQMNDSHQSNTASN